jgi:hypothetical protein
MARLFIAPGFARTRSRFVSRGPTTVSKRQHTRLYLEFLECRCVPSTVTNLADSGPGSLRDALATTSAGGTVDFQPGLNGTITLTSGELDITQEVNIAGPGSSIITVSGNKASRVFNIRAPFTVSISGLTIANGSVDTGSGGGIYNSGTLAVTACAVRDNTVTSHAVPSNGAGIFNAGRMMISSSIISGNTAVDSGGGIENAGTMTVTDCTFLDNTAYGGGGLSNDGVATIISSLIHENTSEYAGVTNDEASVPGQK